MMEFERILKLSPDDVCARGYLISAYPHDWSISQSASQHISRTEHLLWMVRNHAEWDGFTITPLYSLMNPRSVVERGSRTQLKQAWTEQIGPMQHRGIVLHNAALFFAMSDPELAVTLLKRAISAEPEEPLFIAALGMIYAYSRVPAVCFERRGISERSTSPVFDKEAEEVLTKTGDWKLLAGALTAASFKDPCAPERNDLMARLRELQPDQRLWNPSSLSRYQRNQCPFTPPDH